MPKVDSLAVALASAGEVEQVSETLGRLIDVLHEYADKNDLPNARVTGLVVPLGQAKGLLMGVIKELKDNGVPVE